MDGNCSQPDQTVGHLSLHIRHQTEIVIPSFPHLLPSVTYYIVKECQWRGIDNEDIDLQVEVYPNPSQGDVYLVISQWNGLEFKLFDLQGKLLMSAPITEEKTTIPLEKYSHSGYLLNVIQDQKTNKTFRIIKKQ